MGGPLRTRVTIRCVVEDLRLELPPVEVDIASLAHPLIAEARRLTPSAPTGQKRILTIARPIVYRLRHGRWRGASWVDERGRKFWLCAGAQREAGAADDAFEHFLNLHRAGRLLPSGDDELRDRAEETARTIADAQAMLPKALDQALARLGHDAPFTLVPGIAGRLHVPVTGDEVWIAFSTRMADDGFVRDGLRDILFAVALEVTDAVDAEPRPDWPSGRLEWHEVARLGLRAAQEPR